MSKDNIVQFKKMTSVEATLESASKAELKEVLVVGLTQDDGIVCGYSEMESTIRTIGYLDFLKAFVTDRLVT